MKVRHAVLSTVAVCLLSAGAAAWAAPKIQGRQISVQAEDVQHYLSSSFPQTHDALGGLLELTVSDPKLTLPPGNRLNMVFDLAMATGGGGATPVGNVSLSSALRYDASRQGFYLDQPTIDDFRPATSGAKLDSTTRELLNVWLTDYARKEPIYKIDPAIAGLLGNIQVESAAVENGHLAVTFNQDIEKLVPAGALSGQ